MLLCRIELGLKVNEVRGLGFLRKHLGGELFEAVGEWRLRGEIVNLKMALIVGGECSIGQIKSFELGFDSAN